jgi:oligoendopeptidase F
VTDVPIERGTGSLGGWDLTQVFPDDEAALAEARTIVEDCRALADRSQAAGPADWPALVEELGALEERAASLDDYARMRQYGDAAGEETQRVAARGQAAAAEASAELARALDAWRRLGDDEAAAVLTRDELEPARHRLARARDLRRHRLEPAAERAWAAREESGRVRWASLHEQLEASARVPFDDGTGSRPWDLGALWGVTRRSERPVRRAAYEAIASLAADLADVVATCWDAAVADRLAEDRLRGYVHPAQATLDEQELPLAALASLVDAVWGRLPARHALYARQEALLDVDAFVPADADAEPPGLPPVTAEDAWTASVAGLAALASPLADQADELRAAGRVDLADRQGKQAYAATFCTALDPPAFVGMRFSGRAAHVGTVGHELGHAVALGSMRRAQPPVARGWPGALFEVPSLLCELATGDALVGAAEERHRDALDVVGAQDLAWCVFEAIAFCRVELDLYRARAAGEVLTADRILAACRERFGALFGAVCPFSERDALVSMTAWANYATGAGYRFYNFQYAVGALCALALLDRRARDEERFGHDLLRFLAYGRRVSPSEQLAVFELDLGPELWARGLDAFEARVSGTRSRP